MKGSICWRACRQIDRLLPVIVMTGWGSVDLAVEAMRRGVRDFVQKPWDNAQLLATLRQEIDGGPRAPPRRRRRAARAGRGAEDPAAAAAAAGAADRRLGARRRRGSPRRASAATASTRSASATRAWRSPIADVVGKGIPAALLMSNLQAAVRAFASEAAEPQALCHQVNRILCGNIAEGRFISFFYCVLDAPTGVLTYTNAGHYLPMLVRADGIVERLGAGGPVLGVLAGRRVRTGARRARPRRSRSCSSPTA